jgi:hypothetical protein
MLALTGTALVAGVMFSAGPAVASSSTAQGTTAATQSTQEAGKATRGRTWIHDSYRSRGLCIRAGLIGQRFDRWDRFRCVPVGHGFRTSYRLVVTQNWGGDWDGHGHGNGNGNGHWDNDGHGNGHGGHHWDNNRSRR